MTTQDLISEGSRVETQSPRFPGKLHHAGGLYHVCEAMEMPKGLEGR